MGKAKLVKIAETKEMPNILEFPEGIKGNWGRDYFENDNPIVLELACGKGHYTVALSEAYPDKNFIGVDIKGVRLWKGASIALEKKLDNAVFLRIMIDHIDQYFAEGEVDEIWITFPDPFPKKGKAKKRLVHPKFLRLYEQIIKPEGILHLKTDNTGLFEYALEVFEEEKVNILDCTKNLYESELYVGATRIKTHYEELFTNEGSNIKYARFKLPPLEQPL